MLVNVQWYICWWGGFVSCMAFFFFGTSVYHEHVHSNYVYSFAFCEGVRRKVLHSYEAGENLLDYIENTRLVHFTHCFVLLNIFSPTFACLPPLPLLSTDMADVEYEEGQQWDNAVEEEEAYDHSAEVKLFGKWTLIDVQTADISLVDYLTVTARPTYLPHTAGRYAVKRFRKAQCPIVERVVNSLMMHGRNNGKKLMTVRIVKHSFEIIHLLTGENPIQVLVDAIKNSGPREDSTRIGSAGTVRRQAVDVSPLRRVNQAIWLLTTGAREAAFRNIKTIAECLADELINAAKVYYHFIMIQVNIVHGDYVFCFGENWIFDGEPGG